ncbi:hypothetical protein V1226_14340 [Lachnospiraceae bacterium JLR.KK009]
MATGKRALKKAKLRHAEYYDFQSIQDGLYRDSMDGKEFRNLISIITMPENIRMAYRSLKKNLRQNIHSMTAGIPTAVQPEEISLPRCGEAD